MKRLFTIIFFVITSVSYGQICGNTIILRGTAATSTFKNAILYDRGADVADTSQPEIPVTAWTCNVFGVPTCNSRSVAWYDVSSVPSNAIIISAKLYLYPTTANINGQTGNPMFNQQPNPDLNTVLVQKITAPWDLATVSWNNPPSITTLNQKTIPPATDDVAPLQIDLLDFVQEWVVNPSGNYGVLFRLKTEQFYNSMIFYSGHADDAHKPRLEIIYNLPNTAQLIIRGSATGGNFDQVLINSRAPVNGDYSQLEIPASAWTCNVFGVPECQTRGLFKYNLTTIPLNSEIVSARLYLYANPNNINGQTGNPMFGTNNVSLLQKVITPWTLGTTGWDNQPSVTTTNQKILPQSISTVQDYVIDVKDFVQSWVDNPSENYGVLLRVQTEQYYNSMIFYSGQAPDDKKPRIEICYRPLQAPLPVRLLAFDGLARNREVVLNWSTTNDDDLKLMKVERSIDAKDFNAIGVVNATGHAGQNDYQFTDNNLPVNDKLYYRLRLTDSDDRFRFSNIVRVSFKKPGNNSLQVFPNPAKEYVQVSFDADKDGIIYFIISDAAGRSLIRQQKAIHKGINNITLNDVQSLSAGVYFITATIAGEIMNSKLVIQ